MTLLESKFGHLSLTDRESPPEIVKGQNTVRITGVRRDQFIEFDFYAGDPQLHIELILPYTAFVEFCAANNVEYLPVSESAQTDYDRLCWRNGDSLPNNKGIKQCP